MTRALALLAAAVWRPWTPGQPESDAITALFVLADRFAGWIEGDE